MDTHIVFAKINGVSYEKSQIPLQESWLGLKYGYGFFETVFVREGQIDLWPLHTERITEAVGIYKLPAKDLNKRFFQKLESVIKAEIKSQKTLHARVRLTFFSQQSNLDYLVEFRPLEEVAPLRRDPIRKLILSEKYRVNRNALSGPKPLSYAVFLAAQKEAEMQQLPTVLLLNNENQVCEGATTNIFWHDGKQWVTPSLATGCVSGVMRRFIIETLRKNNIGVVEGVYNHMQYTMMAKEVFLSNAGGIYYVQSISSRPLGSRAFEKMFGLVESAIRPVQLVG